MADICAAADRNIAGRERAFLHIGSRSVRQSLCLKGHKIDQVMHVQHVSRGEEAGHACLTELVDDGTFCVVIHNGSRADGQFIFRDESDGQDQSITRIFLLGAGDGLQMFIHL